MDWSEIDLVNDCIVVPASKAKTRRARYVTISPNLRQWLDREAEASGLVVATGNIDVFGERLRRITKAAGVDPWPRNALRHTFASHYYERTRSADQTAAELGNSPTVLFRHYRALVSPAETEAFWNIPPCSCAGL